MLIGLKLCGQPAALKRGHDNRSRRVGQVISKSEPGNLNFSAGRDVAKRRTSPWSEPLGKSSGSSHHQYPRHSAKLESVLTAIQESVTALFGSSKRGPEQR